MMKSSLAYYSHRLSRRVFRQTQRQQQQCAAVRSFAASARPLPEEQHAYVTVNGSSSSTTTNNITRNKSNNLKQKVPSATTKTTAISSSVATSNMPNDTVVYHKKEEQITGQQHDIDSPSEIRYSGSTTMPLTTVLHIVKPQEDDVPRGIWPVFRLMVRSGFIVLLKLADCDPFLPRLFCM